MIGPNLIYSISIKKDQLKKSLDDSKDYKYIPIGIFNFAVCMYNIPIAKVYFIPITEYSIKITVHPLGSLQELDIVSISNSDELLSELNKLTPVTQV